MRQGDQFQEPFCYLKKLDFNIFQQPSTWHKIKTNWIKLQTIDPRICLSLTCQKRVWEQFLRNILCVIFQEKYFSCYTLLTDQISLIFGNICIAVVCFPGCGVIHFEINLIFLIKPFFCMIESQDKNLNIFRTKRDFKVK